jgi:hypothetical protein
MATKNSTALKLIPKTSKTKAGTSTLNGSNRKAIVREILQGIFIEVESDCPKKAGDSGVSQGDSMINNHFAWNASQLNIDLAVAANCESEGDIGCCDDNYLEFFRSSEYQKLQQTFREEVESGHPHALVNFAWRLYNAGLYSPERKEPDSASERKLRHIRRNTLAVAK